jgi:hypothetical protein
MNPWTDHSVDFLAPEHAEANFDWIGTLDLTLETSRCAFGPVGFYGKI